MSIKPLSLTLKQIWNIKNHFPNGTSQKINCYNGKLYDSTFIRNTKTGDDALIVQDKNSTLQIKFNEKNSTYDTEQTGFVAHDREMGYVSYNQDPSIALQNLIDGFKEGFGFDINQQTNLVRPQPR